MSTLIEICIEYILWALKKSYLRFTNIEWQTQVSFSTTDSIHFWGNIEVIGNKSDEGVSRAVRNMS